MLFHFRKNIGELFVVHLHAVVQIDGDHLIGKMVQLLFEGARFRQLIAKRFQTFIELGAFCALRRFDCVFGVGDLRSIALLLLVYVIGANAREEVGCT